MLLLLLVIAVVVLAGPVALGWWAATVHDGAVRALLVLLGCALPPLTWVLLWFWERMTAHGGDFSHYSDGDLGIVLGGYLSIGLLLVSTPSALITLAVRKGRQVRQAGL